MTSTLIYILVIVVLLTTSCNYERPWKYISQFQSAAFQGADRAWFVTLRGELLRTTDGGKTWLTPGSGPTATFGHVSFIDPMKGWAVDESGVILRTADAGDTWNKIAKLEYESSVGPIEQIKFIDELHGWVVDPFSVWRTENGGTQWIRYSISSRPEHFKGATHHMCFLTPQLGWLCGENGVIYKTENGGRDWRRQTAEGLETTLSDIFFVDNETGWVTGYSDGGLYRTDDGGESWRLLLDLSPDKRLAIESIHFVSKTGGWAVGQSWLRQDSSEPAGRRGVVLRTTDGGRRWESVQVGEHEPLFVRVHFTDAGNAWLLSRDNLYKTNDSGNTWRIVLKLPPIEESRK